MHRRLWIVAPLFLALAASAHANTEKPDVRGSSGSSSVSHLLEQGKRHEHGVGADQDMDRAIQFYCAAAGLGNAEAHYHLGWIYSTGRAGKIDEVLGAAWFKTAAAAKHPRAELQVEKLGAKDVELGQASECILSGEMVARSIPRTRSAPSPAKSSSQESSIAVRDVDRNDIRGLVRRLAPDYSLDPNLVLAVVEVESNFNPQARSHKNAQGLMQLIPETAARFGVKNVWEPLENLRGGMAYLRWLLDHFNGNVELALAGYNAGENAVHKYGGIPPYAETQGYVKRITKKLNARKTSPPIRPATIHANQPATSSLDEGDGPRYKTITVSRSSS